MKLLSRKIPAKAAPLARSLDLQLSDGSKTPVHIVRYDRKSYRPHLVSFEDAQPLAAWCRENDAAEAMGGGFYIRSTGMPLGDLWIDGQEIPSTPVVQPWGSLRSCLSIDREGGLTLGPRGGFSARPSGDLLQAGPLLVGDGVNMLKAYGEREGFSAAAGQFDSDITDGRYPRGAIGCNDNFIWTITCDGSSDAHTGLTLSELADVFIGLGATSALNLDGGGSACQVTNGALLNHPYGDGQSWADGRPIYNAIVFR